MDTASEASYGSVQRQVQRLVDQMQKNFFNFCPSETWTPNVNLYETETAYLVCVDLAGVDKEKISVLVADQKLTLRGTRHVPTPPADEPVEPPTLPHPQRLRVHVMEIDHGPFCREVELPADVVHERITAAHVNGLLWIELPKK
jgi:HSP20 family protein